MSQRKAVIRLILIAAGIGTSLLSLFAFQLGLDNDPGWGLVRRRTLWIGITAIVFGLSYWVVPILVHRVEKVIYPALDKLLLVQKLKTFYARYLEPLLSPQYFDGYRHKPWVGWINRHQTELLLVVTTAFTIWLYTWTITAGRMHTWPSGKDYYWMLAQAFQNGQTHLMVDPPPALLELNNPYDYRERKDLNYLWDTTLYGGKYYLYWGPVPAVVGWMVNSITSRPVTDAGLVFAFSLGAALFSTLLLLAVHHDYKFPDWALWGGIFASIGNGVVTWILARPAYYEVSISGGQFFLLAAYTLCYFAFRSGSPKKRFLFLSALAFGLAGGTRINLLPSVFLISLLILWRIYTASQRKFLASLPAFAATLIPLTLVACSLLWYNQIRFGSILEFGHRFQLTGGSVTEDYRDQISAAYIVPNLYTYVFRKPSISVEFPFLRVPRVEDAMWPSFIRLPRNYFYGEPVAGILFVVPLIGLTAILLLRWLWIVANGDAVLSNEKRDGGYDGLLWLLLGYSVIQSFILLIFVSSAMRYLLDISPSVILFSTLCVGKYVRILEEKPYMVSIIACVWVLSSLLTVASGVFFGITGLRDNFLNENPGLYHQLYEWFHR